MNNNSFIENLNNLINIAVGYGELRSNKDEEAIEYKNKIIGYANDLLACLDIREKYRTIDISKSNIIPEFLEEDTWTDCIIVNQEIKHELIKQKENGLYDNTLILKTDYEGRQELWQRLI